MTSDPKMCHFRLDKKPNKELVDRYEEWLLSKLIQILCDIPLVVVCSLLSCIINWYKVYKAISTFNYLIIIENDLNSTMTQGIWSTNYLAQ